VLADAGGWPGDGATPATAINGKVTAVHLFGHVSIVNARRAAIKVGGLTARGMTQLTGQVVEVSQTFADHGF